MTVRYLAAALYNSLVVLRKFVVYPLFAPMLGKGGFALKHVCKRRIVGLSHKLVCKRVQAVFSQTLQQHGRYNYTRIEMLAVLPVMELYATQNCGNILFFGYAVVKREHRFALLVARVRARRRIEILAVYSRAHVSRKFKQSFVLLAV